MAKKIKFNGKYYTQHGYWEMYKVNAVSVAKGLRKKGYLVRIRKTKSPTTKGIRWTIFKRKK